MAPPITLLIALPLFLPVAVQAATTELQPVPNLEAQIQAFKDESGRSSPLTPEDRAVMQRAAEDLAIALPDPGIQVGERAPEFALPNARGETVSLKQLLRQGPVVLTFYRGAWCPYCNLELKALRDTLPHIRGYGASLVAITPQTPDRSLKQVEEDGYPFEILSDLDNRVMQAYRLYFQVPEELNRLYQQKLGLDLAEYNGEGRYGLPVPGTFVIDQTGVVRAAFADTDYTRRMEPQAILDALAGLPR